MGVTSSEIVLFLIGQIIVAAAIWGAIRADIKAMHVRISDLKDAIEQAHRRIDEHLDSTINHSRSPLI